MQNHVNIILSSNVLTGILIKSGIAIFKQFDLVLEALGEHPGRDQN